METTADGRLRLSQKQNIELIANWDDGVGRFVMSARVVSVLPVPCRDERKRWRLKRGETVVHLVPVGRGILKDRAAALLNSFVSDPLLMVVPEQLPLFEIGIA